MRPAAEILRILAEVHADLPGGGEADEADRRAVEDRAGPATATYGEITPAAACRLLDWLRPTAADVLVDVGSGTGRLVQQAILTTAVGRAVGIELSRFRHAIACRARRGLAAVLPDQARRLEQDLELVAGDLRERMPVDPSLVWAGSICFPDALMTALARALLAAPSFRRLVTLKPLPRAIEGRFAALGFLDLDMSWAPRVRAAVYGPRRGI